MATLLTRVIKRSAFAAAGAACAVFVAAAPQALAQAPGAPAVVDASSMVGKVMCGYQGWFNTPNDGADRGWVHWGRGSCKPGTASFDLWPDTSELSPDELCPTGFKFPDGQVAQLFSSYNPKTVDRHFQWMRDYGIDGVFLQRFTSGIGRPDVMRHYGRVLQNVRDGAEHYGRAWGMMYDLSGTKSNDIEKVMNDWKMLIDQDHITQDKQYIHQDGKPVVVLWGMGFSDGRDPLLEAGPRIINFLKSDPRYGGNEVMIGVPGGWRTQDTTAVPAQAYQKTLLAADIIQPWSVGSYNSPEAAVRKAQTVWVGDLAWCKAHGKLYMPVVFPGFSWHNLKSAHQKAPTDQIPRLGGRFLWTQYVQAKQIGVPMVYQAMFDEVDEGTAIFKVASDVVPDGEGKSVFLSLHGLPSDFYLKLVGEGTQLIRGEITPEQEHLIGKTAEQSAADH